MSKETREPPRDSRLVQYPTDPRAGCDCGTARPEPELDLDRQDNALHMPLVVLRTSLYRTQVLIGQDSAESTRCICYTTHQALAVSI
jgi:hypothetical protein